MQKHKKHYIFAGFNYISQTPLMSFLFIFTVSFVVFLVTSFYVLWKNMNAAEDVLGRGAEIVLYLKGSVNADTAKNLVIGLTQDGAIREAKLISPDEGLKVFAKNTDFGEILSDFKENPLPNVVVVKPKLSNVTASSLIELVNKLQNISAVEVAKVDMNWVLSSYHFLHLWKKLSLILLFLLSISAPIILCGTSFTISQIIMKKDAACNAYVLRGQCFWHCTIGSFFSLLLAKLILIVLKNPVFNLCGINFWVVISVILFSILFGTIGLNFAVKKCCK